MSNKITVESISAKNFRSIGNMPIVLNYREHKTNLIVSDDNGAGKSTLSIWALYFNWFDKPYGKDCKKPGLVNSKSNKDCVTESVFKAKGSEWKVIRGIKPNIFEIWRDGKKIEDQDEAVGDSLQNYLERYVLGFDEKVFACTIALGVAKFVPFISMSAPERRNYSEQMLDMVVVSQMSNDIKDGLKLINKESEQLRYKIDMKDSEIGSVHRTIGIIQSMIDSANQNKQKEIDDIEAEIADLVSKRDTINLELTPLALQLVDGIEDTLRKLEQGYSNAVRDMEAIKKSAEDFSKLDNCPTCKQEVGSDHKKEIVGVMLSKYKTLIQPKSRLEDKIEEVRGNKKQNDDLKLLIGKKQSDVSNLNSTIDIKLKQLSTIVSKSDDDNESKLHAEQDRYMNLQVEKNDLSVQLDEVLFDVKKHQCLLEVLKDDGYKSEVIKQYLPYLNTKINHYLDKMNLYIQLDMDEEFNVSMYAPNRKNQDVANLSTGQLRRVDLAILLAWRDLANQKASVSCNLLILDEILENLSQVGVEEFIEMWEIDKNDQDLNLFVITQRKDEFSQYFDNVIGYRLKNDLTEQFNP